MKTFILLCRKLKEYNYMKFDTVNNRLILLEMCKRVKLKMKL